MFVETFMVSRQLFLMKLVTEFFSLAAPAGHFSLLFDNDRLSEQQSAKYQRLHASGRVL